MNNHEATEIAYKNGYEAGKPKWIPVTERLPEVRVPVLTLSVQRKVGIGFLTQGSVVNDGKAYFYARYGASMPTHWMPLPELPKED